MTAAEALARLQACALAGDRCPTNDVIGARNIRLLVERGELRVEVYTLNWRTVEILKGEHAGKRTAECPYGEKPKPYRIIPSDDHSFKVGLRRKIQAGALPDFKETL